jgi:hypothetical protein
MAGHFGKNCRLGRRTAFHSASVLQLAGFHLPRIIIPPSLGRGTELRPPASLPALSIEFAELKAGFDYQVSMNSTIGSMTPVKPSRGISPVSYTRP